MKRKAKPKPVVVRWTRDEGRALLVRCPGCREFVAPTGRIEKDGTLADSFQCPDRAGCGYSAPVTRLMNWIGEEIESLPVALSRDEHITRQP